MPISAIVASDILLAFEVIPEFCATVAAAFRRKVCDVAVHTGVGAMDEAAPAWRALEFEGGAASAFQTFVIAQACAAAHLAQCETPRIITVRERGRPVVVLPTVVARQAGIASIRFLGDPFIQYGDALVSADARPDHVAAAFGAAADPAVASMLYLRKVRADAHIARLLANDAVQTAEQRAPFVDLSHEYAPCRDTRRSARKLAQAGDVRLHVSQGASVADVREALSLKRAWLEASGLHSSVVGNPAWENVALQIAEQREPRLAVARLTAGGELAATEIAFVHNGTWHSYLGAVAPRFAKSGPGKVQIAQAITHCRTQGLSAYDLLAPAQPYKDAIATGAVAVRDYALPLDALGRVALLAVRCAPELRAGIERLPPSIRRVVRGFAGL